LSCDKIGGGAGVVLFIAEKNRGNEEMGEGERKVVYQVIN
jgi:hypothetical protein